MSHSVATPLSFPCAVHVGFSGARQLSPAQRTALESKLTDWFKPDGELARRLALAAYHRFVVVSQIAIGADQTVAAVCDRLQIPQRLVLPQPLDDYLTAVSDRSRTPDFTDDERFETKRLARLPHIIETRVASKSADRRVRFQDASIAILKTCDILLTVVAPGTGSGEGGTKELIDQAKARGVPVIELTLTDGPTGITVTASPDALTPYRAPTLPGDLFHPTASGPLLTESRKALSDLAAHCRHESQNAKWRYKFLAVIIIALHVIATTLAVSSVLVAMLMPSDKVVGLTLLTLEIVLLVAGMFIHRELHHSHTARRWALSRLVRETLRAGEATNHFPMVARHLDQLLYPPELRGLLQTISVLGLMANRDDPDSHWKTARDAYVKNRLDAPAPKGQIDYYTTQLAVLSFWTSTIRRIFYSFVVVAIVACLLKLASFGIGSPLADILKTLGPGFIMAAILAPVIAVAGLSWSIALGYDVRHATYRDAAETLTRDRRPHLANALTRDEFEREVRACERILLGETVNWFYRQSFADVG